MQDTSYIEKALIRESRQRLLRKWRRKIREAKRKENDTYDDHEAYYYQGIIKTYQSCIDDLLREGQLE